MHFNTSKPSIHLVMLSHVTLVRGMWRRVSAMVQRKLKKKLSRPMAIGRETILVHGVTNHSFKA